MKQKQKQNIRECGCVAGMDINGNVNEDFDSRVISLRVNGFLSVDAQWNHALMLDTEPMKSFQKLYVLSLFFYFPRGETFGDKKWAFIKECMSS